MHIEIKIAHIETKLNDDITFFKCYTSNGM